MVDFNLNEVKKEIKVRGERFQNFKQNQVSRINNKPEGIKDTVIVWMRRRPTISVLTSAIIIALIMYSGLPFLFFSFIPDIIFTYLLYGIIVFFPAHYGSRWAYKYLVGPPDIEIIREINLGDTPMVEDTPVLRGTFKEEFEMKDGKPVEERNSAGQPIYNVIKLDKENQVAYCSYWGDLPQAKLFETKEALRAQFMYNDELRKFGAEIDMKKGQIMSQVRYNVINAKLRDIHELEHGKETIEASEDGIPTRDMGLDEPEMDEILEKVGVDKPQDLEPDTGGDD